MGQSVRIFKEFSFEAAHRLPNLPQEHKCYRLHGHSFRARLTLEGSIDPQLGWFIDFADVKQAFARIHDQLDHRFLNEIEGLNNPTSENLAVWIWQNLKPRLPQLCEVTVHETCTTGATYRGG